MYSMDKGMTMPWVGEARKSIVVGNGYGDFLAVPTGADEWDLPLPRSRRGSGEESLCDGYKPSYHHRRDSGRSNLWR